MFWVFVSQQRFARQAKGRLCSICVLSVTLYGIEAWPVKEEDVIRLEQNDLRIIRWMCNVSPEDGIPAKKT